MPGGVATGGADDPTAALDHRGQRLDRRHARDAADDARPQGRVDSDGIDAGGDGEKNARRSDRACFSRRALRRHGRSTRSRREARRRHLRSVLTTSNDSFSAVPSRGPSLVSPVATGTSSRTTANGGSGTGRAGCLGEQPCVQTRIAFEEIRARWTKGWAGTPSISWKGRPRLERRGDLGSARFATIASRGHVTAQGRTRMWVIQGAAAHYMGYRLPYLLLRTLYRMLARSRSCRASSGGTHGPQSTARATVRRSGRTRLRAREQRPRHLSTPCPGLREAGRNAAVARLDRTGLSTFSPARGATPRTPTFGSSIAVMSSNPWLRNQPTTSLSEWRESYSGERASNHVNRSSRTVLGRTVRRPHAVRGCSGEPRTLGRPRGARPEDVRERSSRPGKDRLREAGHSEGVEDVFRKPERIEPPGIHPDVHDRPVSHTSSALDAHLVHPVCGGYAIRPDEVERLLSDGSAKRFAWMMWTLGRSFVYANASSTASLMRRRRLQQHRCSAI